MRAIKFAIILLFFSWQAIFADLSVTPNPYIQKDICTNGCCSNSLKIVSETTAIHLSPNKNAKIKTNLKPGDIVECITGEIHFFPSLFNVKKTFKKYQTGDIIYVYEYIEEGIFTVWFDGQIYEEDLGFDPNNQSTGDCCQLSEMCLGELDKSLQSTSWVKVRTMSGDIGWTDKPQNFRDKGSAN